LYASQHSHTLDRIFRLKQCTRKSRIEQKISKKIVLQEYVLDFSFVAFFLYGCANFNLKLAQPWVLANWLEQKNRE